MILQAPWGGANPRDSHATLIGSITRHVQRETGATAALTLKQRIGIVSILLVLYGLSVLLGMLTLPGHQSAGTRLRCKG